MIKKKTLRYLSQILATIPTSKEKPAKLLSLFPNVPQKQKKEILHQTEGVLTSLHIFNALEVTSSGIRAKSESAGYFLQSLSRYFKNNYSLITNWERPGLDEDFELEKLLTWGSNFLYFMEYKRVMRLGDTTPIRFVDVAQIIIKAKVDGHKEPMYLMQYDMKAHQFQFIGGRKNNKDKDMLSVIQREIKEELPLNKFSYKKNYQLNPLLEKYIS